MPYTPRSSREILRDMSARMVARSELTDLNEGSVLYDLLATFAEQVAESDVRLSQIRDQFTLEGASGVDLDERAEELGVTRLSASRASGEATLTRTDTSSALTVPLGSEVGRSDADTTYATLDNVTFSVGVASVSVRVQAQVAGVVGNAPSFTLDTLVSTPSGVTGVSQPTSISNGNDAETDSGLRARCRRRLNALSRCTPSSMEYAALTFRASDDTRATIATVYEPSTSVGRVELLVDDGSGLADTASTRAGANVSQGVTLASSFIIGTERAIASGPTVSRARLGLPSVTLIEGVDYIVNRGAGVVTILEGANVSLGDVVHVTSYTVYEGLIAELQGLIEGDVGDPSTGYRPAGITVRVLPAPVQRMDVDLLITVADGANVSTVTTQAQTACVDYLSSLGAGSPAYIARVIDAVMDVSGVINVRAQRPSSNDLAIDQYTLSPRHIVRAGTVRAITSTTGG